MKIALIGYGKMGKEIEKVALSRGHEIVSIIDINNQDDFESEAFKSADVAIEFTKHMVASYRIQMVPTFILFRKGEALWRHSGVISGKELKAIIEQNS